MNKVLKNFIYVSFLPLVLFRDILRSKRSVGKKIGYYFLIFVLFGLLWLSGYLNLRSALSYGLYTIGITDQITKIKVRGTSMMPTIMDGEEVTLKSVNKHGLERGDIVSFRNLETGNFHYLKRIVGLPNEKISIKNGLVTIEGKILQEGYILNKLPTFGNTFLTDCDSYIIPKDSFVVMGDNRTVSSDSRVIGYVHKDDIFGVIKMNLEERFFPPGAQIELLKKEINLGNFLTKLNERRLENMTPELVTHQQLNDLAQERASQIKDNFYGWKKDALPIDKFLDQHGYSYNLVHEFVTFGYLDEEGILGQIMESMIEKEIFLSEKYLEIGVGVVEMTNLGCTFPAISVIISWPSIPTYDAEVIEIWANEVAGSSEFLNKIQALVGAPGYDQNKVKTLIAKVAEASEIATRVHKKMSNQEWLSEKDNQDIEHYSSLIEEIEKEAQSLAETSPAVPTGSPLPVQISTPTPGSTKFNSAGQKAIEGEITATINRAWEEGGKVKIQVTFGNNSSSSGNVSPVRLVMSSQTHGTGPQPAYLQLTLNPGQTRSFEISYDKIDNPPYSFVYTNSAGEAINLGSYNP